MLGRHDGKHLHKKVFFRNRVFPVNNVVPQFTGTNLGVQGKAGVFSFN